MANNGIPALLEPEYTPAERDELDALQSRLNVARAVLRARLDQQLTQEELGKAAGTKQARVSEIESLKGNVRFDTLDRIAKVLGLVVALVERQRHWGFIDPYNVERLVISRASTTPQYAGWKQEDSVEVPLATGTHG